MATSTMVTQGLEPRRNYGSQTPANLKREAALQKHQLTPTSLMVYAEQSAGNMFETAYQKCVSLSFVVKQSSASVTDN